jgi:two-component system, sensor histidine kinase and response regulator
MSKILVIEDEDAVRENILELLTEEEYEVIGACDGDEGVRLIWQELPDLIICDILMPGLDGYGVLAKIGQDVRLSSIPFLFLTARVSREDMRRGMGLGADDYITKPFSRSELLQAIASRLGRIQNLQTYAQKKFQDLQKNIAMNLPHELLTPISVTMGYSELLVNQADELSTEEIRSLAQDIYHSTGCLVSMVENYLLFAELQSYQGDGAQRAKYERVEELDAKAIIIDLAQENAREARRDADLDILIQAGSVPIYEAHLAKIIEELIANAFRLSPKGSPIVLRGEPLLSKSIYRIKVSSQGRGLSKEQVHGITNFSSGFRQVAPNSELGLYLVKMICDLYHGTLRIVSQPQKSTQVEVDLPIQIHSV